jgi:GDP-mannose transporter
MLLVNKVVITLVPLPACIFAFQLAAAVAFVLICRAFGLLAVDELTLMRVLDFAPYIVLFVISVYCNGRALERSNTETVIVFRASSPLFVSVMDFLFLGRALPSKRSLLSLGGVILGAVGYMQADSEFQMSGMSAYFWVSVYTVAIVLEMTYGKYVVSKVKFDTPVWGSVMYTNVLGLPPMLVLALMSGEIDRIETFDFTPLATWTLLIASCAIGVGIGWAGWHCRNLISATSYTLVGVICKLITVIANVLIWNKHATPIGIFWLLVCLGASSAYQQAPLRDTSTSKTELKLAVDGLDHDKDTPGDCQEQVKSPESTTLEALDAGDAASQGGQRQRTVPAV